MIKKWERGAIFMIVSSLFLSVLALCVKVGVEQISVAQLTFLRYFAPLLVCLPYFIYKGFFSELKLTASLSTHLLRSAAAVCSQWSLTYYLTQASILDGVMLWCTGPLFVPLLARIFYHQKIAKITWISLAISFVGVAFIIKPTIGIFDPFSIWGLLSGLATAFSQILWGQNAEKGKVSENLFYLFFFATVLSAIPLLVIGLVVGGGERYVVSFNWFFFFIVAGFAVASIGNQLFRSKAYKESSPTLLSPILYASVIGSGIFDWLVFNNPPDIWVYIGFALVVIGGLVKWQYLKKQLKPY